jgi:hypothetical protein
MARATQRGARPKVGGGATRLTLGRRPSSPSSKAGAGPTGTRVGAAVAAPLGIGASDAAALGPMRPDGNANCDAGSRWWRAVLDARDGACRCQPVDRAAASAVPAPQASRPGHPSRPCTARTRAEAVIPAWSETPLGDVGGVGTSCPSQAHLAAGESCPIRPKPGPSCRTGEPPLPVRLNHPVVVQDVAAGRGGGQYDGHRVPGRRRGAGPGSPGRAVSASRLVAGPPGTAGGGRHRPGR